jgi:hypothetical protein
MMQHLPPQHGAGSSEQSPGRILRDRVRAALKLRLLIAAGLLLLVAFGPSACRTSSPTGPGNGITLSLDAVPLLLKADSTSVSTLWATVLDAGRPVRDSTVVYFAASLGVVTSQAVTRDGLARATFTPSKTSGVAAVIAQVKAVRDTVLITVY